MNGGLQSTVQVLQRPRRGGCAADFPAQAGLLALGYGAMSSAPPAPTELDVLLHRVAGQDVDAFTTFYDLTRARVFGLVSRVLRDPGYSEETTQEVYLQVWQNAAKFNPTTGSALAWLLTLTHRRAVDRVRSEQAAGRRDFHYGVTTTEPPADVVAEAAILDEEHRRVTECLDSLTDNQRQCIDLAYYGGLTYVEVSERLSAKLATIKSRMRDALRGLRNCLGVS